MNDKGRKEDASVRIVGREFIIIIVVVFSSLSFALGFFVGKNNAEKKAEYVVQAAPKPAYSEPQQNAVTAQLQPPKPEGRPINGEAQVQDKKTAQQAISSHPESRTDGDKTGLEHGEAVSNLPKEAKKKEAEESAETNNKSNAKPGGSETIYTVQLGALKDAAEARRLKAKYLKKGYKIYITASRNKHKEKIFKVRSGEFKEKKDAEILALRLKKNEGVAAFVTVSNN
jgi:cell division protein FtsN